MSRRALLAALLCLPAAASFADECAAGAEPAETAPPPPEYLAAIQKKAPIDALGDHWSGLDRWALFQELEADDLKAAAARVRDAAKSSDRPGALWAMLAELASTDVFEPVRLQVEAVARALVDARQPAASRLARRDTEAQVDELACAHVYAYVLGDRPSARACYERVLGPERSRRVARGREDDSSDLNDHERGAARRLRELAQATAATNGAEVSP